MQIPLTCIAVLGVERQQILSASGVASSQPYTDRKVSFCAWLLVPEQPELLIVEDMTADSRWALHSHLGAFWPKTRRDSWTFIQRTRSKKGL